MIDIDTRIAGSQGGMLQDCANCSATIWPPGAGEQIIAKGLNGITAVYRADLDTVIISTASDTAVDGPGSGTCSALPHSLPAEDARRNGHRRSLRPQWQSNRTEAGNYMYWGEHAATATMVGPCSRTLTVVNTGHVVLNSLSAIAVVKRGMRVQLYGPRYLGEARQEAVAVIDGERVHYLRPDHIAQRRLPTLTGESRIRNVVNDRYGVSVSAVHPLAGGWRNGAVHLVVTDAGQQMVFRYLGRDATNATAVVSAARLAADVFPRLHMTVDGDPVLVVDGGCYCLEGFVRGHHALAGTSEYFISLGETMGRFHSAVQGPNAADLIGNLPPHGPTRLADQAMALDLTVERDWASECRHNPCPSHQWLLENYEALRKCVVSLTESDYTERIRRLPQQILHRDLSPLNVLQDDDGRFRFVDLETMCRAARVLEFPLALIGRGAGNPLGYVPGSFQAICDGYNSMAERPLTPDELSLIRDLVVHRFVLQFVYTVVKRPVQDANHLDRMMTSLRRFCEEQNWRST